MTPDSTPLLLDRGLRHGDEVEVLITETTERGLGLAHLPALVGPDRMPKNYEIFVRKALPGDRARVIIEQSRRSRCTGRWIELIEKSPLRIEPRCPHFGRREEPGKGCGGCSFQSTSYRHQLLIKERMVKDQMKKAGIDTGYVLPVKGLDDSWYYRNKMEFTFGDDANRGFALGLFPTGYKYEILNLEACYIASEFVAQFLPQVRAWAIQQGLQPFLGERKGGFLRNLVLREGKNTGERLVELITSTDEVVSAGEELVPARQVLASFQELCAAFGDEITSLYWTRVHVQKGTPTTWTEELLAGEEFLTEELRLPDGQTFRFEIHPRAFFQPNTRGAELLYSEVVNLANLNQENQAETILDLYCGTGTIGLCMAPFAEKVLGIEMQADAVENARKNAALNAVENIQFFAGDVGKVLQSDDFRAQSTSSVDLIIVDPPRAGLYNEAIEHILEIGPRRLVYVSCNPTTLAKNLADFQAQGYQIERIQPVDMFPQTFHIENIALLTRKTV